MNTDQGPTEEQVRAIRADMQRLHQSVAAFRERYVRMRGRQQLVRSASTGICLALAFNAVMEQDVASAVLASVGVLVIGQFPVLPRNPRVLFEGKDE